MRPLVTFCAEVPQINASISWLLLVNVWQFYDQTEGAYLLTSRVRQAEVQNVLDIWQNGDRKLQHLAHFFANGSSWWDWWFMCVVRLPILKRCKFVSSMILKHFIFSYTLLRTHAREHSHTHTQPDTHPPPSSRVRTHTHTHAHTRTHTHTHSLTHALTHTHRQTDIQTDRQTERAQHYTTQHNTTQWLPFRRRHFQTHFREWNYINCD